MDESLTLTKLSAILNLSKGTISKSLNDSDEISVTIKERVRKMAATYNYSPNENAYGLSPQRSRTIGVILPKITRTFYVKALEAITAQSNKLSYTVIALFSEESQELEKQNVEYLIQKRIDGIIIVPTIETQIYKKTDHLKQILNKKIPLIIFDRIIPEMDCDQLDINNSFLTERATLDLIRSGKTNTLFITRGRGTALDELKKQGYLKAIKQNRVQSHFLEFHKEDDHKTFKTKIESLNINGIILSDESLTHQVYQSVLKWGYRIPEDITIIAFSSRIQQECSLNRVLTIDQDTSVYGKKAVNLLFHRMEKSFVNQDFQIYKM
ncbi:LacI family DNA-binding transcriptional regulator [Zunongwangia atlantica]|uniref:LacI family transcriptional regulator n=2 Tax=Zunongwangia TaxID=417127 RepID=A0A1Y1SYR5_9FLAO|nr:LacI family DNA-binding transcriptional regulator [Zunongwangia atlantica]ORL43897.1 LacI family transcriptional regulator [Zunongwangia atlantica 22II14-10F7]